MVVHNSETLATGTVVSLRNRASISRHAINSAAVSAEVTFANSKLKRPVDVGESWVVELVVGVCGNRIKVGTVLVVIGVGRVGGRVGIGCITNVNAVKNVCKLEVSTGVRLARVLMGSGLRVIKIWEVIVDVKIGTRTLRIGEGVCAYGRTRTIEIGRAMLDVDAGVRTLDILWGMVSSK